MKIILCSPVRGEKISLLPSSHKVMLSGGINVQADNDLDWENLKRKGTENSYPLPVRFVWRREDMGADGKEQKLLLSTDPEFSDPRVIDCPAGVREAEVYNLRADRQYYWKIAYGEEESAAASFCTIDETPTLYRVDGLTNIRDIGGWHTADAPQLHQQCPD